MSLLANHGSSYFKAKTNSLTPLNFGCHKPKPIKRILDVYKPIVGENLLVPHLKAFAIKRTLRLAMQYHIYRKKMG